MITIELSGQLGNHMFQYATCRTVAETLGYDWAIPRNFSGLGLFDIDLGTEPGPALAEWQESDHQFYDPNLLRIKDGTLLKGYFQTDRYWRHRRDDVRSWFKLNLDRSDLYQGLDLAGNTCLIHLRGTDYKQFTFFGKDVMLPVSYYARAVDIMRAVYGNDCKFIVITDDLPLAQQWFPGALVVSSDRNSDFWLLTHARRLIIPNSTFSWWAAYLNRSCELTIAPRYWCAYNGNTEWEPRDAQTDLFVYLDSDGNMIKGDLPVRIVAQ
jgi:Glycosyl transferase family 11